MNTDLEQELRGAMERFTGDVRVPPGLALKAYRHRQKRRMTGRAAVAAGTATVVAGSLAVAGAAGAFGSAGGAPVQTAYTAYVVSHVEHALASSRLDHLVEFDRTVYQGGRTLQPVQDGLVGGPATSSPWMVGSSLHWTYHRTMTLSAFSPAGQRVFDDRLSSTFGDTAVIYFNRTWWTAPAPAPGPAGPAPAGLGPAGCVQGQTIELSGGAGNGWPAFIRSQLACGAYTVAGHQVIDGIDAIKITGASGQFTFWVDPATYLPLQMALPQQQTEFRWLAATPANLAHLKVTVPAGFKQVQPPSASTR
jgi:hypothetical protein